MPAIIMDSCNYTKMGLTNYLTQKGMERKTILSLLNTEQLQHNFQQEKPDIVFINEACFIHNVNTSEYVRDIIKKLPDTLFFIFMSISDIHFEEYLHVRNNLVITSKAIRLSAIDLLLHNYLRKGKNTVRLMSPQKTHLLTLSKTESNMLKMWMSGHNTIKISEEMKIKSKTVSSHKGNIKRKIKTHNKQIVYHVVRLMDNVTSGIFVSLR
ncbi:transcriptional regulator RcsA [Enterobacteriaceae bacterium LUAb1]